MSDPIEAKALPQTAAQRQRKYQQALQARGQTRIALVLQCKTVAHMRRISNEHGVPFSDVVGAGVQLVARELDAIAAKRGASDE